MSVRDPDLGRDRTTAALGRRDWGFFTSDTGMAPVDLEPAEAPWDSLRRVSAHDRFDRTLGIPERQVSMWPLDSGPGGAERAAAICAEILDRAPSERVWPDPRRALALLGDVARRLDDRSLGAQKTTIAAAAARHRIDPTVAVELAGGVGAMVAQTTHRAAPGRGASRFNILAGTNLAEALELFLARDRIRTAQAHSDPDLPRLWMLANGLAHGVPAAIMARVPGRSVGPAAKIVPLHDDLVGWEATATAVKHMAATVAAAAEGRRWLAAKSSLGGPGDAAVAAGVVALTRPRSAAVLVRGGLGRVRLEQARAFAGPAPGGVLDLSDDALKSVCDRNGWLLGAASERTQRELVQRAVAPDAGEQLRTRLAGGDIAALDETLAGAPDDAALDRRAFRKNPPAGDVAATQALLRAAGVEAQARFAGFAVEPRASYAEAFAHRFPAQLAKGPLTEADPARLAGPEVAAPAPVARRRGGPAEADLGL